jgi:hypothetical protein
MSSATRRGYPWLLWPVVALWDLLAFVLKLTGRLIGVAIGLALMIAGAVLCFTLIALPVGIPLLVIGFALMLRGIF